MDVKSYGTKRWYTDGLVGRKGDGMYGLSGVSISTHTNREAVGLKTSGSILEVWYLQQPGGGSLELSDDGNVMDTISTDGEVAPGYYRKQVAPGPHEFALQVQSSNPVRLFGCGTGNPTGINYESMGIT